MTKSKLEANAALLFGLFSAGILLILPVRVYQYLKIIEPVTGFYEKTDFSVVLLYALLAVFCGTIVMVSFARKRAIVYSTTTRKSPALGTLALIVAVTLVIDAVLMSKNYSSLYYGAQTLADESSGGMMKSGAVPMLFESAFAVLSALFFTILGVGFITGKSNGAEYKLLAITPLAWAICRILHRFMRTISFMRVSDLFFELLMIVCLMVFFMAFAQMIARVNHKGADWKIVGFGLPAALLCLLCFVPRAAMMVMGKGGLLAAQSPPEYVDFALAMFILAFVLTKMRFLKREEV